MLQEFLLLNGADVDAKLSQLKTDVKTDVSRIIIAKFCCIFLNCKLIYVICNQRMIV